MTISPAEWLDYAKNSVGVASEAARRSAASRAYYGAYHAVRPIAEPLALKRNVSLGSHEGLIKALTEVRTNDVGNQRANAYRSLGHLLSQARVSRISADYKVNAAFTEKQVATAIEEAEAVISHIAAYESLLS